MNMGTSQLHNPETDQSRSPLLIRKTSCGLSGCWSNSGSGGTDRSAFGLQRSSPWPVPAPACRMGLNIRSPLKSLSLSVTSTQSFASATAARIMSSALRGLPWALPSAIRRAQTKPALSSNDRIRPAKSTCGPSSPVNQASRASLFLPLGSSRMPRRISAMVNEATNRSSSRRAAIQSNRSADGCGLTVLLMMFVSSR